MPPGIETRPVGGPADALRVLAALSGAAVEEGMPAFTDNEMVEILDHPIHGQIEHWIVAWEGAVPVAGVLGWVDAAENAEQRRARAYTERITTVPGWRRRGIASALLVRAMDHFRAAGMTETALSVDTDNASGALGLYERLGFGSSPRTWCNIASSSRLITQLAMRRGGSIPPRPTSSP